MRAIRKKVVIVTQIILTTEVALSRSAIGDSSTPEAIMEEIGQFAGG
jgi:hypothetical protein